MLDVLDIVADHIKEQARGDGIVDHESSPGIQDLVRLPVYLLVDGQEGHGVGRLLLDFEIAVWVVWIRALDLDEAVGGQSVDHAADLEGEVVEMAEVGLG